MDTRPDDHAPPATRFAGRPAMRVLKWCVLAALLGDLAVSILSAAGVCGAANLAIGSGITLVATRVATSPRYGRGWLAVPLTVSAALAVLLLIPTVTRRVDRRVVPGLVGAVRRLTGVAVPVVFAVRRGRARGRFSPRWRALGLLQQVGAVPMPA